MRGAAVLAVLLLAGCAQSLAVTGQSLKAVGEEYEAVSLVFGQACQGGVIAPVTCAKYRSFQERFRKAYPLAVGVWDAARKANDANAQKQARVAIEGLAADLSALAVEGLGYIPKGAP